MGLLPKVIDVPIEAIVCYIVLHSIPVAHPADFVLPHLNWLTDFDNCSNWIHTDDKVKLSFGIKYQNHAVPFRISNGVPKRRHPTSVHFHKWSLCQTISIVFKFNKKVVDTNFKYVPPNLTKILARFGYSNSGICRYVGHYCVLTVHKHMIKWADISRKPLGMLPILIFFIIINDYQKDFYHLEFTSLYYNPFLQIPYRFSYSTNPENSLLTGSNIKSEPENVVFICKFCSNSNRSENVEKLLSDKNPFTEIPVICPHTVAGKGCRLKMHETYLRITGDGKYFTYFNFENSRFQLEKMLYIQKASSAYKVIKTGSKLDEIVFSILIEGMPLPYNPQSWHDARQFPAVDVKTINSFVDVKDLIENCDRTAYVGEQREILEGVKYFRRYCNHRIYSGRDALFLKSGIWYAQESGGYYMRNRLRYLSYSGIHQHWMQLIELSHNLFPTKSCNEDESEYTSLSMTSNIVVIFYAVVCGWGISFMGLTVEYAVSNHMKLREILKYYYVRNCTNATKSDSTT
ncbi:unnamed protein product [Orchesella dallaii]|uniref:Uncharacterized protein n=1 Tax=Orchesella dallaii TaxID=48710 RepID=A0ABP1S8V7_9HEXA